MLRCEEKKTFRRSTTNLFWQYRENSLLAEYIVSLDNTSLVGTTLSFSLLGCGSGFLVGSGFWKIWIRIRSIRKIAFRSGLNTLKSFFINFEKLHLKYIDFSTSTIAIILLVDLFSWFDIIDTQYIFDYVPTLTQNNNSYEAYSVDQFYWPYYMSKK